MSEKPLLLPSASTQPQSRPISHAIFRAILALCGTFFVLYGASDLITRLENLSFGAGGGSIAFGSVADSFSPLATSSPLVPSRLIIPSIGVDARVEPVGNDQHGAMKTPSSFGDVAWYALGSRPGEPGSAVIAGHVNNALTKAGVFEHLDLLHTGDTLELRDTLGASHTYAVRDIENYAPGGAPLDAIFSKQGPSQVVLITCAGDWDPKARSYDERLVIFASLIR